MRRYSRAALLGLALSSSMIAALLAQQDARALRRLFIAGSFVPAFNAERTELTLAAGDGPIGGVAVRAPEGGSLSVTREPIPGTEKRRLIVTLAAGAPGPEPSREPPPPTGPSAPPPSPGPPTMSPSPRPSSASSLEPGCRPKCKISQMCELQDEGIRKCVDPPWLPVSCAARPDDPPGLQREGPGCDAKGGSGTGIITVTALGPDGDSGTLRWAYRRVNSRNRRIVCDPQLQGDITLNTHLDWEKPYSTLDFSSCDVVVKASRAGQDAIVIGATHNIIFYSVRGVGHFTGDPNWVSVNNAGVFAMDGDSGATRYPWDDLWEKTPPALRRTVRSSLFDRVTAIGCEDDCLAMWEGVRDTTVSRSLIQGYHPTTMGAKGVPLSPDRWRLRVAYLYNVWFDSGERQTKPREQTHLWVYARNLVYNWKWYRLKSKGGSNWPLGLNISDDAADENDLGWVIGACFVPGPGSSDPQLGNHSKWGVVVGNHFGCDAGANNCPDSDGTDHACCNTKMVKTRWLFEANEGSASEGVTNPRDYVPVPLPFSVDKTRPWTRVLAEVGVVRRNAAEQALVDRITAEVSRCKVPK